MPVLTHPLRAAGEAWRLLGVSGSHLGGSIMQSLSRLGGRPPLGQVLPHMRWRNLIVVAIIAVAVVWFLFTFVDRPVLDGLAGLDRETKGQILVLAILGKADWKLVVAGLICFLGHNIAHATTGLRARIIKLHWATTAGFVFWAVASPGIVVAILKQGIGRPRPLWVAAGHNPEFDPWSGYYHASFPSGDSCNAAAFAVALGLLFPRWRIPLVIFALLVALGRVLTDRHYVSDAVAGLAIGAAGAYAIAVLFARLGHVFSIAPEGALQLRGRKLPFWDTGRAYRHDTRSAGRKEKVRADDGSNPEA